MRCLRWEWVRAWLVCGFAILGVGERACWMETRCLAGEVTAVIRVEGEVDDALPTVGVLGFREQGEAVKGMGGKLATLLSMQLAVSGRYPVVEREEMDRLIEELELSASGLVNSATSNRIGQLVGARILVTGSVLETGGKLYLVAKIMGTETSRVVGVSVKGELSGDLAEMTEELTKGVEAEIEKHMQDLLPVPVKMEDRMAELKKRIGGSKLPSLSIAIAESQVGQAMRDPAAETEFLRICRELGFEVLSGPSEDAEVKLLGEAISEGGPRRRNFYSAKGRLELKAIEVKTQKVLHADRRTVVVADLNEQLTGKAALQLAAMQLAEDFLPKMIKARTLANESR